jgi:hypothetical protein
MSAVTLGLTAAQIALIGSAVAATGIGATAYESNNSSIDNANAQKANAAATLKAQQTAANQANLTKQEAVLGQQGQAQSQTGGSLTDPGTAALTDLLAGYPGFQSGGTGASTGTGAGSGGVSGGTATPAQASGASGTGAPDIASILAALRGQGGAGASGSGSSISGGNWQTQPPAPQSQFELSNPVIG